MKYIRLSKEQLDNNEGLIDFVDQRVEDMLDKSPSYLQRLARGVTDLRGRVETVDVVITSIIPCGGYEEMAVIAGSVNCVFH